MPESTSLRLPLLVAEQAQKHVTHNEALRALDAIVQLAVKDRDLAAPPGSPAEGDRYIVAASPTGGWSGHAADIAVWQDGAWDFHAPREGWRCWVDDENVFLIFDGSAWVDWGAALGALQNLSLLGVGTTADATNPFSAKLNKALWTAKYAADGGDGDLRSTLNKETAADVLSLLMQTGFSARAEIGLIGDDDLLMKVSPDGSAWHEGIRIDKSTGAVSFPNTSIAGGGRELLTAARTYYVRTDGSDSNTGLVNSSGGAFLTIQKAVDAAVALDLGNFDVTIQIGNGTYTGAVALKNVIGAGKVIIKGDSTTPSNVVISTTSANAVSSDGTARGTYEIDGVKVQTTTSGLGIFIRGAGITVRIKNINFGTIVAAQLAAYDQGSILIVGNYTISGGASTHYEMSGGGVINRTAAITVTLSGTPVFSIFCYASGVSFINIAGFTFSGSATGTRYTADSNAVIQTGGGGASYVPGNSAGSTATGGQYV